MAIYSCLIDSRLVRDISKDEAAIMVKLYRHTKFGANHMLEEERTRRHEITVGCFACSFRATEERWHT